MVTMRLKRFINLLILLPLLSGCGLGKREPTMTPLIPWTDNAIPAQADNFKYNDCPFEIPNDMPADMVSKIECATLTVPEDWRKRDGPKIDLAIAIVKTSSDAPKPDPVLVFIGQTGFGLDFAYAMPFLFPTIFEQRDFIVVDQRGTGYSQPSFSCPEIANLNYNAVSDISLKETNDKFLEASKNCANTILATGVNLPAYTTAAMAADMEALRQAMGITQWNIFTISNGSRLALEMMRAYPQGIRSVAMDSVVPPQANPAAEWGSNALSILDSFFQDCTDDDNCGKAYPQVKETFYNLLDQIDAEPIEVDVSNLNSGDRYKVMLDSERLISFLLGSLNSVEGSDTLAEVPRMIYQLRDRKTEAAARLLGSTDSLNMPLSAMGLWLDCSDEMNFITLDQVKKANAQVGQRIQQYFNTQAEGSINACEPWKAPKAAASENLPVSSSIPTLLLAGEYDWAEPAAWAEQTAKSLRYSTVVVFSGAGQLAYMSSQWTACSHKIVDDFIETPTTKPDTSCATKTSKITWITLP
jgi:pimeloyl-ACP methyl ester carboxylesterase